jgi:two-component system response regulator FixJ
MNAHSIPPQPGTVYVVDDEAGMRAALRRVFMAAGLTTQEFASAREFLALDEPSRPAVLVLDVRMPEMSGLELHAKLIERQSDLPVIFLTGASTVPMAVEAMRGGAVDFLEKPFDNDVLIGRVRMALEADTAAGTKRVRHAGYATRLASLTPREREVLEHMLAGRTSREIGAALGGSHRTMEIHRGRVMMKMRAATTADLVRMMLEDAPARGPKG